MRYLSICFLFFTALFFSACDVDKTESGSLPDVDVDVDVDEGSLPEYDVDWADVDVRTRTEMIKVPKVRVVMEEEAVEVPVVDIDWPSDYGDTEEMTLMVEADVDQDAELDIKEVYATNNRIIVLAELEKEGEMLDEGEMMRVSDQVVLTAPDMDVRYYIIGDRPDGMVNSRNRYIRSRNDLADVMKGGRSIYTRD